MTDNSKLAIAAAVTAVGVGAFLLRPKPKPEEEETWDSHIPSRHGNLEEIQTNLYRLEADGCDYGPPSRNMTIYRVKKNRLMVISAIAVKEETLKEILALGTPSVLVVPNTMHRCCAGVWKSRFPEIIVTCPDFGHPKDARSKIEEVVSVDMTLDEVCQLEDWKGWITPRRIDGWAHFEEILEVKLSEKRKAMIVCDLLFTMPREKDAGMFTSLVQWIFDSSIDEPEPGNIMIPKISRVARLFGILDWKKAESWYRNYAQDYGPNIAAIMVGHGPPVVELEEGEGCTRALIGIADQLTTPRW